MSTTPTSRTELLRDGRSVHVRPIQPADAEPLMAFDGGLCEASRRFRYQGWMPLLSAQQALVMATVDFRHQFALVATTGREGGEVIVADCRLDAEPGYPAEIAIAVADDHQGAGLGPTLIREMLAIAADRGIESVVACVLDGNERMLRVLRRLGFRLTAAEFGIVTFDVRPLGFSEPALSVAS